MQDIPSNLASSSASEILRWALSRFGARFAIATGLQREGLALIDMAVRIDPHTRVFTLETGRLPAETFAMIETVRERYGITVELVRPDDREVAEMVARHGRDLFYDSVDKRLLCCEVRKVRPLARKLRELDAWATGLRREQSESRAGTPVAEWADGKVKLNPLAAWTAEDLDRYTREHDVPMHPLYARGFASIGCEPCTRAVHPGEGKRSGRWWWEEGTAKECGIHVTPEGLVRRA